MPLRNLWSLEPKNVVVAEEIMKNYEAYFPARDVSLDLLVVKDDKHVGVKSKNHTTTTANVGAGQIGPPLASNEEADLKK